MQATVEFEQILMLIKHEASDTTPSSVYLRYKKRLTELRSELRMQAHVTPLGAILVAIDALSDEQLNLALTKQQLSTPKKLWGEFLIEMRWISQDALAHALSIQSFDSRLSTPRPVCNKEVYRAKRAICKCGPVPSEE